MTAPKVGDVVAWALCGTIPWGTILRTKDGRFILVSEGCFRCVGHNGDWFYQPKNWGTGGRLEEGARWDLLEGDAVIIAVNLTGQETAADLRRIAEVFEVREALKAWGPTEWSALPSHRGEMPAPLTDLVHRLYALGWRNGMTAEDAAQLLRGAGG